ncbi:MAG: hypothetical protein GOP50_07385 [Candidatus Heimdallarchaeota archaeon]|nr:hypothetical protein [Candidatus Heimdallarchaeota archaeon]
MARFFSRKDPAKNYLNKAIIGLGAGLVKSQKILNLSFGPQGAMDILSIWIGQELAKELLAQKKIKVGISDQDLISKLLDEIQLAEDLTFENVEGKSSVTIQNCLICPKKVGGYDLDGDTACPVGGILMGALTYVKGESPSLPNINLKPGELCKISLDVSP